MNSGFKQILIFIFAIGMVFSCMTGCSSDDAYKNTINVCNYDNEDCLVKLYSADGGILVREFELEKFEVVSSCDGFDDLDAGWYYVIIHEGNSELPSDTSDIFHVDSNDHIHFSIDASGELNN